MRRFAHRLLLPSLCAIGCLIILTAWRWSSQAYGAANPPSRAARRAVASIRGDTIHVEVRSGDTTKEESIIRDSIDAGEITIDASGITIVDRKGRHIRLTEGGMPLPPGLPPAAGEPIRIEEWGIPGQSAERTSIVRLVGDVDVEADEFVQGDVVCIFGDIRLKGRTAGSAVSVFGNIDVDGGIGEDAVAPFGRVRIGSTGTVRQNVVASQIAREPGGRVGGTRQEVLFNMFGSDWGPPSVWARSTLAFLILVKILFWIFLVLLAHAIAARNIGKVKAKIQSSFFKSFMVGVLGQILSFPIWLLLVVTIVGIPVALFLFPLMLFAALVLAQAAVGQLVGEKVDQNTALSLKTPAARTIGGVLILQSFAILSLLFVMATGPTDWGGFMRIFTLGLVALSVLVGYVVLTIGTGAVVMTRFGTRPKEPLPALAPAADIPPASPAAPAPTPLPHPTIGS